MDDRKISRQILEGKPPGKPRNRWQESVDDPTYTTRKNGMKAWEGQGRHRTVAPQRKKNTKEHLFSIKEILEVGYRPISYGRVGT